MFTIRVDHKKAPAKGVRLDITPAAWEAIRAGLTEALTIATKAIMKGAPRGR